MTEKRMSMTQGVQILQYTFYVLFKFHQLGFKYVKNDIFKLTFTNLVNLMKRII